MFVVPKENWKGKKTLGHNLWISAFPLSFSFELLLQTGKSLSISFLIYFHCVQNQEAPWSFSFTSCFFCIWVSGKPYGSDVDRKFDSKSSCERSKELCCSCSGSWD